VFARIAHYYTADPSSPFWELAQSRPVRVRMREMLRQMDGYEGSSFFLDRKSGKAISISLWESEEAINRSEEAMRPLREEMARSLAANIVDVEHYEVGEMAVQDIRERERVEQELQVARRIQQASLPKEVPTPEGWQIAPFTGQPGRWEGTSTTSSSYPMDA
jgi:heme-degrading monooxygenase HmoA